MSASTTKAYMAELKDIVAELKEVTVRARTLRKRQKELESQVMEYVEENELPGIKYDNLVFLRDETTRRSLKTKKEKEDCVIEELEKLGISDSRKAYESISRAMQGEERTFTKAKIKITVPELL